MRRETAPLRVRGDDGLTHYYGALGVDSTERLRNLLTQSINGILSHKTQEGTTFLGDDVTIVGETKARVDCVLCASGRCVL